MTSQTKTRLKRWAKNSPLYLLMFVGAALFVYFVLYRPYTIHLEKKSYEKAESSLNELYEKIVQKIGLPDQKKNNKSCAYSSEEFGRGDLGCAVSVSVLYENIGLADASSKMEVASTIVGSKIYSGPGEENQRLFISSRLNSNQTFTQDFGNLEEISCSIGYTYPANPSSTINMFQTKFEENLQIELSCGGSAKTEHYPVV